MSKGKAIRFAYKGIVRIELPALIDQIVVVCAVVTNKVPILVCGVVDA